MRLILLKKVKARIFLISKSPDFLLKPVLANEKFTAAFYSFLLLMI